MGCGMYITPGSGLPDIGGGDMRAFGSLKMESLSVAGEVEPQPACEWGDMDSPWVWKYFTFWSGPGTIAGWATVFFRLRAHIKQIATAAAATTARPPTTPPMIGPMLDFLAGGGVGGGVGVLGDTGVVGVDEVVAK